MKNFESDIYENLAIDQAYITAEKTLARERIPLGDFKDLYGEENIVQDEKYVAEMERKFRVQEDPSRAHTEKLATIFECVLHEQAELNEWLGPNVTTIKTSRFDDVKNGVDSVAELRETESSASYLALAIDATFSSDTQKKFDRIKEELVQGKLATVKYFISDHMNIRGELGQIPRVVIGADVATVKELSELWLERENKKLAIHPIQFQILEEIIMQLETFGAYAAKLKKHNITAVYEKSAKLFREILREKEKHIPDSGMRDRVFEDIQANLRIFI